MKGLLPEKYMLLCLKLIGGLQCSLIGHGQLAADVIGNLSLEFPEKANSIATAEWTQLMIRSNIILK